MPSKFIQTKFVLSVEKLIPCNHAPATLLYIDLSLTKLLGVGAVVKQYAAELSAIAECRLCCGLRFKVEQKRQ